MLIYSMSVSVGGFIAAREGAFGWAAPNEEQLRFHIAQTRALGGHLCGRRLYETMLVWETDPSRRDDELGVVGLAMPAMNGVALATAGLPPVYSTPWPSPRSAT